MLNSKVSKIDKQGELITIQMPILEKTGLVNHCFSTRHGGVSEGIYTSMNLGFHRGDDENNVRMNFERLCEKIGISPYDMVFSDQVHKINIEVVTQKDRGKGFHKERDLSSVDGLITKDPNVALVTFYADCVPLYFLDPTNKVIGLAHAGWKGTAKKIGLKMVERFINEFGTNPKELLIAIGPSIGPCCFEVKEDVKIQFENSFSHDIIEKLIRKEEDNKFFIDLWKANEEIFLELGIPKENIQTNDICTMCNKEDLFSHRGSEGKRGSMVAILSLKGSVME